MTIGNSLWIGVSGLMAHGEAISTVGDNIANVSTVGFKRSRAMFNDLLGGELNNSRLGGGVYLGGNQSIWQQGTLQQTGNPLDVGISGTGMFVVNGNHAGRDGQFFTRDGRFTLDASGTLVTQNGMRVQGYGIANGVRGTSVGDLALGGRQSPPVASTNAAMTLNLDSNSPAQTYDPADPNGTSSYSTSVTVYDSLGAPHQATVHFTKTPANDWEWHATVDGAEVGGTAGTPVEIANGTMAFDANGNLTNQAMLSSSASFTNAAANQAIAFDFTGTTQNSGVSVISASNVDGRSAGSLIDVKINPDGTIDGIYDNGDTIAIAQLALADFANNEGLMREGDSLYTATRESGQVLMDVAGSGGRGSLMSGALEQSNVDLSSELVQLIAYQRAFQANSKIVTTADEMMLEVTNLKR
ncbi:MAG: flagellar hook protein FlgE [Kofleriaceae bacterium]